MLIRTRNTHASSRKVPAQASALASVRALAAAVGLAAMSACGPTEPVSSHLGIDSLTVTPLESAGTFRVVAHRLMTACQASVSVDRVARQDSLFRRFVLTVGRDPDIACPAMPWPLNFAETVSVSTGPTAIYVVRQPDGSSLVERLTAP